MCIFPEITAAIEQKQMKKIAKKKTLKGISFNYKMFFFSYDPPGAMSAGLTCDFTVIFKPMVSDCKNIHRVCTKMNAMLMLYCRTVKLYNNC